MLRVIHNQAFVIHWGDFVLVTCATALETAHAKEVMNSFFIFACVVERKFAKSLVNLFEFWRSEGIKTMAQSSSLNSN